MSGLVTRQRVVCGDAREMRGVPDQSVHLVVTSPPYPMIEMWDGVFAELSPAAGDALASGDAVAAFDFMHGELDRVWAECSRVLAPGGIACINVGDATRTSAGDFRLFSNHARIIQGAARAGLATLPDILWRKPTNAPNKFMGSGMLPPGAYVTYEHEYVLVFRKGGKRAFEDAEAKRLRQQSAYFWEERNVWFSDVWTDLTGTRQELATPDARARSGAFPFELPYRLIQMFSVYGDTVLDPFAGIGTTLAAALASGRNGIVVERDASLVRVIRSTLERAPGAGERRGAERLAAHREFVDARTRAGRPPAHVSQVYGFPVVTRQEVALELLAVADVVAEGDATVAATHARLTERTLFA
jgi:DNA modification methylase